MDPDLERWMNERGLTERGLSAIGATYQDGIISYPRYGRHGGPRLGWKRRDIRTGRTWGEPSGIAHRDCEPLRVSHSGNESVCLICEGETDTMRMAQSCIPGLVNGVVWCVPGATAFPSEWAADLRHFVEVVVFADGDEAGMALPDRVAQLVPGTKVVRMPEGEDVCSFLIKNDEMDLYKLYMIAPIMVPSAGKIRRLNFDWDDAVSREHRDKLTRVVMLDVHLKRRGSELVGLCPFHEEKTPSFSINVDKGLYRCFGCGESGDVLNYIMKKRDLSFGDALRVLREMR